MSSDIFISYRGADRVLARKLEYRLRSRWGSRVFRDETGVTSGRSWAKELTDAMREARVIIALVGPGWHISSDETAEDWVRKELATAVQGSKPILPVLVGESEELRPKLASMPEAFQRQAVVVGPELPGFDLYKIAKALGHLGAFHSDDALTLAARRDEMVPQKSLGEAVKALSDGQSLLVVGSSGSGRNALIKRLASKLAGDGNLVATYGAERAGGPRRTHAVISGWIESLAATFGDLNSSFAPGQAGQALVRSVLEAGPDLLSRRVVKASTLLPLGGTQHDQMILEAVRRSTDRWAPFPPTRLRHQSRAVLERFLDYLQVNDPEKSILQGKKLMLVVDHFDGVDTNSAELVHDLLTTNPIDEEFDHVQFVVAAYDTGLKVGRELDWLAHPKITKIDIEEEAAWGDHIQPWLDAHRIDLAQSVRSLIESESNPYRALAKLWYLVDNGLVREMRETRSGNKAAPRQADAKVEWVEAEGKGLLSAEDLLTEDRLLDHMIEEHVPVRHRSLVEAGSLMGRVFSFHAAYAAVDPPAPDHTIDEPLSARERETWSEKARDAWADLKTIDPDGSVLSCSESDAGELIVSIAQADLIGHLRSRISPRTARLYHERLARYLVDPLEPLDRKDYGDQYHRSDLAAEQWTLAGRSREAADAHRNAAQIAELSLAYGESRRHYHSAIRLYTQLIADGQDPTREHEDLLILANCLYRVGQTTRLSGRPHKTRQGKWGAINYLERALDRLAELKILLLKNEPDRWPDGITGPCTRGIPGPNLVRHHLRVYDAVSGHVHLELAQCYEAAVNECRSRTGDELHSCPDCRCNNRIVRDRLFDALRHAEAAQGEAGSRWLLAAASARLAALLTEESLRTESADRNRSDDLAVEAFFHIERIIGLEPYTTEEEHEFADPVSLAWRSAGRLFRHHAREARIAEWCFRQMNDHGDNVTSTVDMVTDRWLGGFLLSICTPGQPGPNLKHAKSLLVKHRDWAIESGILDWRTPAHLRLYLSELVENAADPSKTESRSSHLAEARRHATSERHDRECALFEALEAIIINNTVLPASKPVVDLFREALPELKNDPDKVVVQHGVSRIAGMLLRRCPQLIVKVDEILGHWLRAGWDDVGKWNQRAEEYVESLKGNPILSPCLDSVIDRLAKSRLPPEVYRQAIDTKQVALKLLGIHEEVCIKEEAVDRNVLIRDVEYAAFMHDWYNGADPARLLTLASEWNLKISGEEWSNPRLLQGRLASTVLQKMYGAETVLGTSRYQRITNMVDNCVVGRIDASALAKVFFLANALSEPSNESAQPEDIEPDWQTIAFDEGDIDEAYRLAIKKKEQAPWDLGYTRETGEATDAPAHCTPNVPASVTEHEEVFTEQE